MELKGNFSQKLQWVFIFIAHLILLYWIYFILSEGGSMTVLMMFFHFMGVGLYGALLIFISAWLGRRAVKGKR